MQSSSGFFAAHLLAKVVTNEIKSGGQKGKPNLANIGRLPGRNCRAKLSSRVAVSLPVVASGISARPAAKAIWEPGDAGAFIQGHVVFEGMGPRLASFTWSMVMPACLVVKSK